MGSVTGASQGSNRAVQCALGVALSGNWTWKRRPAGRVAGRVATNTGGVTSLGDVTIIDLDDSVKVNNRPS